MAQRAHLLIPLSIFVLALPARLAAIGRYVTPDELNWVYRSLGLRRALLDGAWAETLQSGHPGVTTTWLGAIAAQLQLFLQPQFAERLAWIGRLQQLSTDNVEAYRQLYAFLNAGRLGVALTVSLCLVAAYYPARALLGRRVALAGALVLALDPFFAGLSGLLHVDGLLASFMLLAVLLALRARQEPASLRQAAGAGLFTALAILTKTPGLFLAAFVPLILLWEPATTLWRRQPANARRPLLQVAVWGAVALIVTLLLLPALWAAPARVFDVVSGLSGRLVDDAVRPTFFLGQMALDHGLLYYPVAALVRLAPLTCVGLIAALVALLRGKEGADVRWLLLFALGFLVAISAAAKKFDRYALPALVALVFVAMWGLGQIAARLKDDGWRVWAGALLLQAAFLSAAWPHPLTAANWLAGGNLVARRLLPSGWGEDAGLAARRLTVQLDQPQQATLYSSSLTGTAPFFPGQIVRLRHANLTRLQADDYILILPEDRRQWSLPEAGVAPLTVPIKGVGVAAIHSGLQAADLQLPALALQPLERRFGTALRLQAGGSAFLPWPQQSIVALRWQAERPAELAAAYQLQIALVDGLGHRWAQQEIPLLNDDGHAPVDWPGGAPQSNSYLFQLPPTLAPGDYLWIARVFDDQGRQQAVYDAEGRFAGTQAEIATLQVSAPPSQPALEIPNPSTGPLAGHAALPATIAAGDPLTLELWWRAQGAGRLRFVLEIAGYERDFMLDSDGWQAGQVYRLRPTWRTPLELAPGRHALFLSVYDDATGQRIAGPSRLGEHQVEARERLFALPQEVDPLQIAAGDLALLQHVSVAAQEGALSVRVIWQAQATTLDDLTTFVHLRDGEQVIAAEDRQPAPPTSRWAAGEVIVESYTLPAPPAGSYTLALGLYDATNGMRLPLVNAAGQRLEGDQYVFPLEAP